MTRYLLAAEADKIQDFIFRSARLREVVGGSQLLTRFCKEVPGLLLPPRAEVVVRDGGSFRILFDDQGQVKAFGERLAEVYRRATGGSLTVADPVELSEPIDEYFSAESEKAEEALRLAKRWRESWQSQEHLPYIAFCASCGVGLAVAHQVYHKGQDAYLCEFCLNKSAERATTELRSFLEDCYREIVGEKGLDQADWPGKVQREGREEIDPLEDVADYDLRRYVAYLLADGNNMGQAFGECRTPEQMRALSEGLSHVIHKALAEPTRLIMDNNPDGRPDFIPVLRRGPRSLPPLSQRNPDGRPDFIPVLPLILGGDDLFALVPAPWALDFARRFCQVYEQQMTDLFKKIGLDGVPSPTVSAAVVICKSKHPYSLAHKTGEKRLEEAKRVGKRLMLDNGQPCSTVNFEVVLGGRLLSPLSNKKVRPTLCPYWVTEGDVPNGWGLPVKRLIEQRYELRNVPHKRLAELRNLYDDPPESLKSEHLTPWKTHLDNLRARIGRKQAHEKALDTVLAVLGENDAVYWYKVDRYPEEDSWYGHGLPDLLEAWDFALDLDKPLREYEEE